MLVLLLLLISRLINRSWLRLSHSKVFSSALWTLEWDNFNPDCLIRISNVETFNFLLNPLFFWIKYRQIKNRFFKIRESLQFMYINLKWRDKFQISRLLICDAKFVNSYFEITRIISHPLKLMSVFKIFLAILTHKWYFLAKTKQEKVFKKLKNFISYTNLIFAFAK